MGLAAAEFVRFAALAAIEEGASSGREAERLATLMERTFRYAYMMTTKMRDEMLEAGQGEELDALVDAARALQDELLGGVPDWDQRVGYAPAPARRASAVGNAAPTLSRPAKPKRLRATQER